jgi:hypothetical protein
MAGRAPQNAELVPGAASQMLETLHTVPAR